MREISTRAFARSLRKQPTSAETRLWGYLRKNALEGFRFIRQATIGPYVVDFLCRERRLAIEVDGATHGDAADVRYDSRRTAFLQSQGYEVHRVNNVDVYENLSGVIESILLKLKTQHVVFERRKAERTPSSPRSSRGAPPPAQLGGG